MAKKPVTKTTPKLVDQSVGDTVKDIPQNKEPVISEVAHITSESISAPDGVKSDPYVPFDSDEQSHILSSTASLDKVDEPVDEPVDELTNEDYGEIQEMLKQNLITQPDPDIITIPVEVRPTRGHQQKLFNDKALKPDGSTVRTRRMVATGSIVGPDLDRKDLTTTSTIRTGMITTAKK